MKRELSTDDVEEYPHIVVLETNGKFSVREFPCGSKAHEFALETMNDDLAGKITVACRVRVLESGKHRFRHKAN